MGQAGNRTDSNLIASNIKWGVSIFWILGSFVGTPPVVWGIVPWYQLTRNIFYNGSTVAPLETPWTYMYDTWATIIYLVLVRNDWSNDFTVVRPMILNKTTFVLTYWASVNINYNSSWGSPIWVQQTMIKSVTHDWAGLIKIIWGSWSSANADWELIYNTWTLAFTTNSYTRNSNNKVAFANPVSSNWTVTISGNDYLFDVFYWYQTNVNIIDPYLQAL